MYLNMSTLKLRTPFTIPGDTPSNDENGMPGFQYELAGYGKTPFFEAAQKCPDARPSKS
jgi:hypothetical protein